MGKAMESVSEFATIAFTLLGILFGMVIMTFIFGLLGSNNLSTLGDTTVSVVNETKAWLNITTYTVDNSGATGFSSLVITSAINDTDNTPIGVGNFTVSGSGFTNATIVNWVNVSVSYTYNRFSDTRINADTAQNDSLIAITAYTGQADTQLLTIGIAITLTILIAVFLLFWIVFIKKKSNNKGAEFG